MTDPQPSTPSEMTDAEFLAIFCERIQPVVGWAKWLTDGGHT